MSLNSWLQRMYSNASQHKFVLQLVQIYQKEFGIIHIGKELYLKTAADFFTFL